MRLLLSLLLICFMASRLKAANPSGDIIAGYLEDGKLGDGIKALESALSANPKEDSIRFQLGLAQFFAAVQKLEQDWHRLGLHDSLLAPVSAGKPQA